MWSWRSPDNMVCTPSPLVEHYGTLHDTIGSILSTSVSTHRVIGTPQVGWFVLLYLLSYIEVNSILIKFSGYNKFWCNQDIHGPPLKR